MAKKKTSTKKASLAVVDYDGSKPLKSVQQELFVTNIIAGMTQHEAYRQAGYKVSEKQLDSAASQLSRNIKIQARIQHRRAALAKATRRTEEDQVKRYAELSEGAEGAGQYSAAVQAEDRICAILGMYAKDNNQRRQALQVNVVYYSHNGDGDNTTPQLQPA